MKCQTCARLTSSSQIHNSDHFCGSPGLLLACHAKATKGGCKLFLKLLSLAPTAHSPIKRQDQECHHGSFLNLQSATTSMEQRSEQFNLSSSTHTEPDGNQEVPWCRGQMFKSPSMGNAGTVRCSQAIWHSAGRAAHKV